MFCIILMPNIVYIEKTVFLEKNAIKKREITQIKCWKELSYPKFLGTMLKQGQITLDIQITGSPDLPLFRNNT
jgi:hypothetical protein